MNMLWSYVPLIWIERPGNVNCRLYYELLAYTCSGVSKQAMTVLIKIRFVLTGF